jgi:hypothetical protein
MTAPLVPADVVFPKQLPYVPIYVQRLFDSTLFAVASDAEFRAAFCLWLKCWYQKPPGSLPSGDRELCYLAGLGGNLAKWRKVKRIALRHWHVCDDERLYHPVVAEMVLDSWDRLNGNRARTSSASLARWKTKGESIRNGQRNGGNLNSTKTPLLNPPATREDLFAMNGFKNGADRPPPVNPKFLNHGDVCQCANCVRWAAMHPQEQRTA